MIAKQHKPERILVDRVSGQPLMTIQLFFKMMLKYGILTLPEALIAFRTGILPQDIMERILKLIDETRQN